MNKLKTFIKGALTLGLAAGATGAMAATSADCVGGGGAGGAITSSGAAFDSFYCTMTEWTTGSLGKGLAVSMLALGGIVGVARNSPMPALSGVAGAAFFSWGPDVIEGIMSSGSGALLF